jgi:hypothetical protein
MAIELFEESWCPGEYAEMKHLRRNGWTVREIADEMDLDESYVRNMLSREFPSVWDE